MTHYQHAMLIARVIPLVDESIKRAMIRQCLKAIKEMLK